MALGATIHTIELALSDVDRNVYETLDLKVAQHPSETMRFLVTRVLAYALEYEEGIAFSKGGISSTDEPPIAIHDPTGILLAWIDVGSPAAERLHKASKAARRVALYTSADLFLLRRELEKQTIYKAEEIAVWRLAPAFVDAIVEKMDRKTKIELTRTDGQLYVVIGKTTLESALERTSLIERT